MSEPDAIRRTGRRAPTQKPAQNLDELLTYNEAGARLKMSAKAVANRARAGLLPRVILGPRDHRIKASALQAYIDAHSERVA